MSERAPRESLTEILQLEDRADGGFGARLESFWGGSERGDWLARASLAATASESRVPAAIQPALHKLLVLLNERLMLGHFDLWGKEGMLLFRQALLLRGSDGATAEQVEDMIEIALSESERYFPAIQFVLWGGKSPEEAIAAARLDTVGEA